MKRFVIVGIVIIASTFALHAGLIALHLFPEQASLQAVSIDQLFGIYIWATAFVFSLIIVPLFYSLVADRRRKGESGDGVHTTGNAALEVTWTVIPLLAVFYLAFLGAQSLSNIRRIDPSAMVVKVIVGQWYYQFQYPDYGIASAELHLPVNRQVDLTLRAVDVIHSFFVPSFRFKQDAVPGLAIHMHFTPTEIGDYEIACAELCGLGHYKMHGMVHVVSQEDFDKWLAAREAEKQ